MVPTEVPFPRCTDIRILPPGIHFGGVLYVVYILIQYLIPLIGKRKPPQAFSSPRDVTSSGQRTKTIINAVFAKGFAEDKTGVVQFIPRNRFCHIVIRHEQAALINIYRLIGADARRCTGIGIHCSDIGEGYPFQAGIGLGGVLCAGNVLCRQIEIISANRKI
ncbi:hypothetical protein [Acetobacterium carbinolicum]|uniref:hypothetical protein n=1 Tax=Acetobacterium carbinolicum TaxID=52690 RepID=UPI003BF5A256